MTKFYVVRHGETLFNRKDLVQGACDSPLTAKGIAQAEAIVDEIAKVDFDLVYSSISERAYDTATIITAGKYDINITKSVKEMNFGEFEGEKNSVLLRPEHNGDWLKVFADGFADVGGETLHQVHSRLLKFVDQVAGDCPDGNVLVVSHGLIVTALGLLADQKMLEEFIGSGQMIGNCSISTFTYDGTLKLDRFNSYEL